MVEALGNKLKINSINIIPSNIDHHNEYLKVADDESKYDLLSVEEMGRQLNVSYEKVGCVNKGNNRVTDVSVTNFSTQLLFSNCSNGYVVTTNAASNYNDTHTLENAYKGITLDYWIAPTMENCWLCIQCPVPMSYTSLLRRISNWYSDIPNLTPYHFIVEASNDNNDFDIILEVTEQELIPEHVYDYHFNDEQIKYRYWRIRYPEAVTTGQEFNFCFKGVVEPNLYTQTEFQKNKLLKLQPMFFNAQIPYRTDYTDVLNHGTVSGSSNLTTYDDNNVVWQAFRGNVNGKNTGWVSAENQEIPCYLMYTCTELQDEGYYQFTFRNGVWDTSADFSAWDVQINVLDENGKGHFVSTITPPDVSGKICSTDVVYIPFKFQKIMWQIKGNYTNYSSMGYCQMYKCDSEGALKGEFNIFNSNVGNQPFAGGYLSYPNIEFLVSEDNPLEVTFNDRHKEIFTSLNSIRIVPQKKFLLISPRHMTSYDTPYKYDFVSDEYEEESDGIATGVGSEQKEFYYGICANMGGTGRCWSSTDGSVTGGPIYKWNKVKKSGRYVFKFQTGWSTATNDKSAKQVRVSVRYGDSDAWKEVWNVNNIPSGKGNGYISPVIDINFDFDQVYFEVLSANSTISTLSGCSVYKEYPRDYMINMGTYAESDYNDDVYLLWEKSFDYMIDYYESQNLFIRKDGTTYGLTSLIYRQDEEPKEPKENDIWYDNSREPLKVYQYKEGSWKPFNDVLLGNFNLFNGLIQTFHENPYNDNGTTKNQDCIWSTELTLSDVATKYDGEPFLIKNLNCNVYHNLNIQDVTKYKVDFELKCVAEDCGYKVGDRVKVDVTPYLTKNTVGIYADVDNWIIKHKSRNTDVVMTAVNRWRPVFKIREL